MRLALLIILTSLMPLVWGGAMYWLIARLWPEREVDDSVARSGTSAHLHDYQI